MELRIILEGKTRYKLLLKAIKYSSLKFMIGRQFKEVEKPMIFGGYYTSFPLWGQIKMLSTRPAYCEENTIETLINELKGITKTSEFDDFGLLKKVEVHECNKHILSNTYEYKRRDNDPKYISKQINLEKIQCANTNILRSYGYDALGNVIKINDNIFGSHEYKYDYRGFLIEADNEKFSYDQNGNILKKGNFILTYDKVIKDRLESFNGIKLEYSDINPLKPICYGSNSYSYEERRLIRWTY